MKFPAESHIIDMNTYLLPLGMISRRNITTSIIHIPYAQTIKSYNCERGAGGVNYTEKLCKILKQYFSTSLLPALATIKIEKLIIIILMS